MKPLTKEHLITQKDGKFVDKMGTKYEGNLYSEERVLSALDGFEEDINNMIFTKYPDTYKCKDCKVEIDILCGNQCLFCRIKELKNKWFQINIIKQVANEKGKGEMK